jgi:hypothetical protein
MCRSIGFGCGIVATAFVVLSVLLAARVGALARRIAPPLPEAPVSVAGECPENEPTDHAMLDPFRAPSEPDSDAPAQLALLDRLR